MTTLSSTRSPTPPVVLTVAGTDSGGAAGVAADLTTFAAHGVHGACVVTAVTAQDTTEVHAVHAPPPEVVAAQVDAVLGDLPVGAVKTGVLGSPAVVRLVAERLAARPDRPLVVDPVLVATSGAVLGDASVAAAYADVLLPRATVVTPNADEARALLGLPPDDTTPAPRLAAALAATGCAVVLTGGPAPGAVPRATCTDWLARPGRSPVPLVHPRVRTENDHGSGCTFSAALAAGLAGGADLEPAVGAAARYVARQLARSADWDLGRGRGPVAHTLDPHPPHRPQETS
ncbi:bifunctional hydroxymethylpyrimidine kinase/phosphomethylpyrimidine kinase [Nocardioides sp. CPCC 205120]|uniref:bifunctional hydroxymethylpyrimidine kinase/phosphomethylpyrimidine kinase n=1 Tax=Nocardioides sp. CPCC 205120 TaxID=3406462 RepID=UPI003B50D90A